MNSISFLSNNKKHGAEEEIFLTDLITRSNIQKLAALEVWDASKRGLLKTLADLANEKRAVVAALLKRSHGSPT